MIKIDEVLAAIRRRQDVTTEEAVRLLAAAPAGDIALLSIARRVIAEIPVLEAWVTVLHQISDVEKKRALLDGLQGLVTGPMRRAAHVKACLPAIPLLVACAAEEALKEPALQILGALASAETEAGAALTALYRTLRSTEMRRQIVRDLAPLRYRWQGVASFLAEIVKEIEPDMKPGVIRFLLDAHALSEEAERSLLAPAEPEGVRLAVIDHWVARARPASEAMVEAAAAAAKRDPSPACRRSALALLENRTAALATALPLFLDLAVSDRDATVRLAAMEALGRRGAIDPAFLQELLKREGDPAVTIAILKALRPHLGAAGAEGEASRAALFGLFETPIAAPLAQYLYPWLEDVLARFPETASLLVPRLATLHHGEVKAALLETLARRVLDLPELPPLFAEACASAVPSVRNAAAQGLLTLPLDEAHIGFVLRGFPLLSDPAVDGERRVRLGRKIARIPILPEEVLKQVTLFLESVNDPHLLPGFHSMVELLAEARERSRPRALHDWALWRSRLHARQEITGVFPAIFAAFDTDPEGATQFLKEILKTENRASGPAMADDTAILEFLQARDRIDDEMSRYALDFLLTRDERYGDMNFYLALLKSNLAFPELKEGLWRVLERGGTNPLLLAEILTLAHHGQAGLIAALGERLRALTRGDELTPYLIFLEENGDWSVVRALIGKLTALIADNPALGEQKNNDRLRRLRARFYFDAVRPGRGVVPQQKPGLLDG